MFPIGDFYAGPADAVAPGDRTPTPLLVEVDCQVFDSVGPFRRAGLHPLIHLYFEPAYSSGAYLNPARKFARFFQPVEVLPSVGDALQTFQLRVS